MVVVLDPGHGGTNTGAFGRPANTHEKRLTLTIAKRTAKVLHRLRPDLAVALTRRRDRYLTLQQRVRRANQVKAAVFVSIHLNASASRSQRGFETFVLSRRASDLEARRLAMRENSNGRTSTPVANDVAGILTDLRQRATHRVSARLALGIQRQLARVRGKAHDRGLRQAPFDVLMGLTMPAALVEVGFIDHPIEGRQMIRDKVQGDIADALARGIIEFLSPAKKTVQPRKKRSRRRR